MTLRPATDSARDAVSALAVLEEAAWFGEPEVSAEAVRGLGVEAHDESARGLCRSVGVAVEREWRICAAG